MVVVLVVLLGLITVSYPFFFVDVMSMRPPASDGSSQEKRVVLYCKSVTCVGKNRSRMSSIDIHTICELCRGRSCDIQRPCDECVSWEEEDFARLEARRESNRKKAASKSAAADPSVSDPSVSDPALQAVTPAPALQAVTPAPSAPRNNPSDSDQGDTNLALVSMISALRESLAKDRQASDARFAKLEAMLSQERPKDPAPSDVPVTVSVPSVSTVSVITTTAMTSVPIVTTVPIMTSVPIVSAIPTVTNVTSVPTSSGLGVAVGNVNVPLGGGLSLGDLAGRGVAPLAHERLGVPSFWLAGCTPAKVDSLLSMVTSMDLDLSDFACWQEFCGWLEVNFTRINPLYQDVIRTHYFAPERLQVDRQPLDIPLAADGTPAAPRSGLDGASPQSHPELRLLAPVVSPVLT